MEGNDGLSLVCRVDARICALPLAGVVETTRPLPIEPVAGSPGFVLGLSVIRGSAVPVVDAAMLLSGRPGSPERFVILKVGERRVALAVDSVVGVRSLATVALQELPPLVRSVEADAVASIGALDAELLMTLNAARIVPEEMLASMGRSALAS